MVHMTLWGDKRRGGNFVLHLPYPDLTSKLYFLNSSYGLLQAQLSWGRLVSPLVPGLRKPEQLCVSLSPHAFLGLFISWQKGCQVRPLMSLSISSPWLASLPLAVTALRSSSRARPSHIFVMWKKPRAPHVPGKC